MAVFILCRRGFLLKSGFIVLFLWFGIIVLLTEISNEGLDVDGHGLKPNPFYRRSTYNSGIVGISRLGLRTIPAGLRNQHTNPVINHGQNDIKRLLEMIQKDAANDSHDSEDLQIPNNKTFRAKVPMKPDDEQVLQKNLTEHVLSRHRVDLNAPGEMGKPVDIDREKLLPEERRTFDEGWKNNSFNQYASDMISVHRSLPDIRDPQCLSIQYNRDLPDTSVVVIFYNEAWSTLLRTVHSVINRSPPHLLKEIILVDDCSTFEHLHQRLQSYVDVMSKVKLVRAKKRSGLIRARLLGAAAANGQVITFLDSHCEVTEGWLEPILDRIAVNTSHVVTPLIDAIDATTLSYIHNSLKDAKVGGFDWNLHFTWHVIPERERLRRKSDIQSIRSPTMAGGLFSIDKAYFKKLGRYDRGMDIWGGENLELSFRIWMCGGVLETVPCSHVGHIFRDRIPYSWGQSHVDVLKKNSIRLAEVWLDEYKTYYYEQFNYKLGDYGDVSDRIALRKNLNCKTFDWFLKNIYPELYVPRGAVAHGEIRSKVTPHCLDSPVPNPFTNKPIQMWPCHNQGGNQFWRLSRDGEIRRDDGCTDYANHLLETRLCHGMKGNQEWIYEMDDTLRLKNTNLCMEVSEDGKKLEMKTCSGIDRQKWLWQRKYAHSDDVI